MFCDKGFIQSFEKVMEGCFGTEPGDVLYKVAILMNSVVDALPMRMSSQTKNLVWNSSPPSFVENLS